MINKEAHPTSCTCLKCADMPKIGPSLTLRPHGNSYRVIFQNGAYIGDFEREVDGYFVYWPNKEKYGFWAAYVLREIADKLDELNASWHKEVERSLSC